MPGSPRRRPPQSADLVTVVAELARQRVDYVLIGGAAMALHGFPRMTKDIDLLLPRSAANNKRLVKALEALRPVLRLEYVPERKTLDAGFSTSAEGELGIDLLFVAASRPYRDYAGHIVTRELDGVAVRILDVDGMLLSKQTDRPEDIPDRQRLSKLKGPAGGR